MTVNPSWPVAAPDGLGPILGADDVRDAVNTTIGTWAPYYLSVLGARLAAAGLIGGPSQLPDPLPPFGQWTNELNYRNVGVGYSPAYEVTCPGTVGKPALKGTTVTVVYACAVRVQVFGTDWQTTADATSWYEKAVRAALLQHRSLGGFAQATAWQGTAYHEVDHSSTRTEGVATLRFDVTVLDTLDVSRGPASLPAPPWSPPPTDPTATTTVLEVEKNPVTVPVTSTPPASSDTISL